MTDYLHFRHRFFFLYNSDGNVFLLFFLKSLDPLEHIVLLVAHLGLLEVHFCLLLCEELDGFLEDVEREGVVAQLIQIDREVNLCTDLLLNLDVCFSLLFNFVGLSQHLIFFQHIGFD